MLAAWSAMLRTAIQALPLGIFLVYLFPEPQFPDILLLVSLFQLQLQRFIGLHQIVGALSHETLH